MFFFEVPLHRFMSAFIIEVSASHDSGGVVISRMYWGDGQIEIERRTLVCKEVFFSVREPAR